MPLSPRSPEELLRSVRFLRDLSGPDLKQLAEGSSVRTVKRGDRLFAEGQNGEGLFVIRTGEIKLTKSGKDGREQILYLASPGAPVVEGVRFDAGPYPANAVAMRDASAILISNEKLSVVGDQSPQLLRALVTLRARRSDRTWALVSDLSLRTVPARLAAFLLSLVASREERGEDGRQLVRELTTETVAGRLGTVREEISRGLAFLEKRGALRVTPELIEVLDLKGLEAVASGKRKGRGKGTTKASSKAATGSGGASKSA